MTHATDGSAAAVRKRVAAGLGASAFGQLVHVLIQGATIPLFLWAWKADVYGEWLLLSTIPAYFAMTDFGFGAAAGNEMTVQVAMGDTTGALQVFQSTWLVVSALVSMALALAIPCIWLVAWQPVLNLAQIGQIEASATLTVLLAGTVVGVQSGFVAVAYRCGGFYARSTVLLRIVQLSEFVTVAGALFLGQGPLVVAALYLFVRAAGTGAMWLDVRRYMPWLEFGVRHGRRDVMRRMAKPAVSFMGFPLGLAMSNQGMVNLIGYLLSPAAVVAFTSVRTVVNIVGQVTSVIGNTVWPELSITIGAGSMDLARRLHRYASQLCVWFVLVVAGLLLVAGEWCIQVWTGGAVQVDSWFLRLSLLGAVVNTTWYVSSLVPAAVNQHSRIAVLYVASMGASLLLAAAFVPRTGLPGVPLALLCTDVILGAFVLRTSLSLLNERATVFLRTLVTPPSFRRLGSWRQAVS